MESNALNKFAKQVAHGMQKKVVCEGAISFRLLDFSTDGYLLHLKPSNDFSDYNADNGESIDHDDIVTEFRSMFPVDRNPSEWVREQLGSTAIREKDVSLGDDDYELAQYLIEYSYNDDAKVIGVVAREYDEFGEELTEEDIAKQKETIRTLNQKLVEFHEMYPEATEWVRHGATGWTGLGTSKEPEGLSPVTEEA